VIASNRQVVLLLVSTFLVATCGIGYELLAGTLSSYLIGNAVTHFSLVIGLFLTAMGIGSYLSRFVSGDLVRAFLVVEIAVGVIGGFMPLALFATFTVAESYTPPLVVMCALIGILVGLEIPLLVRILRQRSSLENSVSNVLTVDYLGALAVSLLFPLVLLPQFGLVRTGAIFGLLNIAAGLLGLHVFGAGIRGSRNLRATAWLCGALLTANFVTAGTTTTVLEDLLYDDDIIYAQTTPYQRLVVTQWRGDTRLYLDGNIQFSSTDEFRYHEALVHPAMSVAQHPRRVLVLGGGDGLVLRDVLEHESVERAVLVDLDPAVVELFRDAPVLRELNRDALRDPRVEIVLGDAHKYLETADEIFDVVIMDLPDPNNESLAKLYSRSFFRLAAKRLAARGVLVTQAASPFFTPDAFWCIVNTIESTPAGPDGEPFVAAPYHVDVPSFGDWGFVLAARAPVAPIDPTRIRVPAETRFLTDALVPGLFEFPKDTGRRPTPINRFDEPVLLELYRQGDRTYHR